MNKQDWKRPDEEMHGKQTSCPKCGLVFGTMMHSYCKHKECPVRDFENKDPHSYSSNSIGIKPIARVAEVYQSRYTLEWMDRNAPEGSWLCLHSDVVEYVKLLKEELAKYKALIVEIDELCGSVKDDTARAVRLSQDDATNTTLVTDIGKEKILGEGHTMRSALKSAIERNQP